MAPGKTVLITGCSDGGIGSALAQTFSAQPGFTVYATARDTNRAAALHSLPNVRLLSLDVTDHDQVESVAATVAAETGGTLGEQ